MRQDLPTGTVTFLFTDVEGSTKLLQELGAAEYAQALAEHRRIVREACKAEGGIEVDTQGDAFFFAFDSAPSAVGAAQAVTDALAPGRIHLRMGLHTGTPVVTDEGYVGADVHRAARIAAAGHGGQVLLAGTTASLVGPDGLVDLGEHRFKDLAAPERVYQLGAGEFPPLKSLHRSNLPMAANPLVGRKKELADVLRYLLDGTRAVTITGPGGVGKTRFALAVAAEAADAFPDGVWFVPLAPLRDPDLVLPTVGEVIGASGDLARHIGDDKSLLLIDNVEHVVDAAPALAALVSECPRLRLMATSREALRIAVEHEYPLSPLPESPSVELFRQRASAVAPDVEIEYEIAAEICDRLDRLPLAIELAAARCKALAPAQVLERLSELLDVLKGGRDADPRQQTLRATIEWSFNLLTAEEQHLFARLSVFRGGCTLDAAEAVCDADLDTLHSLVEKSLIRFSNERYWTLETIREYARERLDEAGERADYELRHARYFFVRTEQAFEERTGPRRPEVLAWYAAEVDNVRAMLDRLADSAPGDVARATHMIFRFWRSGGARDEATQRLKPLLSLELTDDLLAETLALLAETQEAQGELEEARKTAAEALHLSVPGTYARMVALLVTASSEASRGDVDEAIRLSRRATEEAPLDPELQIATRGDFAMLLVQVGRRAEARSVLLDAIGEARRHGLPMNEHWGIGQLGLVDVLEGDYESARAHLTSALPHARTAGHYPFEVFTLQWLGFAYVGLGDRGAARATFAETLELATSRSGRTINPDVALALRALSLAVEPVDFREGVRLSGAVRRLRKEAGGLRSYMWLQEDEIEARFTQPLIEALGQEAYEAARAAGAALSLDETLELARSLAAS